MVMKSWGHTTTMKLKKIIKPKINKLDKFGHRLDSETKAKANQKRKNRLEREGH